MPYISVRVQLAAVVILFLGSLAAMFVNIYGIIGLPRQEVEARNRLRQASAAMARQAGPLSDTLAVGAGTDQHETELREITTTCLKNAPGVEGGFFLDEQDGRFLGYAFPSEEPRGKPKKGLRLSDPPPKEKWYILMQARDCLSLPPGEFVQDTRNVGPSRVVMLTEAVGRHRPARLATWVMYRLTGPEFLEVQRRRYLVATLLALGGIALALFLTWNLLRTLKKQRRQEERLRDELRRAEHLAALGKLLAGVAHEIRNPLAGIRSTVQLWERLPDSTRTPETLTAVVTAVDRLNAIVSRLLLFARVESSERGPVSINDVLEETCNLLKAQADSQGVMLERRLAAGLPEVLGSAQALRQVALNLLTNGLQAMPAGGRSGGRLQVTTGFDRETNAVEIMIADTGPGVPKEDQGHLFEPFFTTRPTGTGLGLALCHEIVSNHGGRIEYLDRQDAPGATFRVFLPCSAATR